MERITTELIIISVGQIGVNSEVVKDVKTDKVQTEEGLTRFFYAICNTSCMKRKPTNYINVER